MTQSKLSSRIRFGRYEALTRSRRHCSTLPWKAAGMALIACLGVGSQAQAQAVQACGDLANHYGPADYRVAPASSKGLVEGAHFTKGVETLTVGKTGPFAADISYTLRVFPNHPRALLAMERLAEKEKANPPKLSDYTIECWYERAMRFQPSDHVVRLLFVNFLVKRNQLEQATQHLEYVISTTPDNPFAQFNAGLLFADMKNYERALIQAHRAQELGLMRPELKERLTAVGRWAEPAVGVASAEAAATAASAASAAH